MITRPRNTALFDLQFRLEKLTRQNDPLDKLNASIDFEFFRKALVSCFLKDKDFRNGGRPSYDFILMFKILLLQRYYNLSDDGIEYAVLDRLSFMRFLGLTLADKVPDASTICNFKNGLAQAEMAHTLFVMLDKLLDKNGIVLLDGYMIDISVAEVTHSNATARSLKPD